MLGKRGLEHRKLKYEDFFLNFAIETPAIARHRRIGQITASTSEVDEVSLMRRFPARQ